MIEGSGSVSLTSGSWSGPKTYGSYGSGSATLKLNTCSVLQVMNKELVDPLAHSRWQYDPAEWELLLSLIFTKLLENFYCLVNFTKQLKCFECPTVLECNWRVFNVPPVLECNPAVFNVPQSGLWIRIRIGSVFNWVCGSVFGIRIRIQEGKNDPQK